MSEIPKIYKNNNWTKFLLVNVPVGRWDYAKVVFFICLYSIFINLLIFSTITNTVLLVVLYTIFSILIPLYFTIVNTLKRLYDIVGDLKKAIFYYVLYMVLVSSLILLTSINKFFDYCSILVCFVMIIILLGVKGKSKSIKVEEETQEKL